MAKRGKSNKELEKYLSSEKAFELKLRREQDKSRKLEAELRKRRFAETKTARVGKTISNLGIGVQRGIKFSRQYSKGRPKGTYDPRYASFGGVYGFRKQLNAKLREQKLNALRNASLSPEQQQALAQLQARRNAERLSPENRLIPDTTGFISMGTVNQEIDDSANLVP